MDEAGNTGSNICNEDQTIFVLSTISFSDEELDSIRKDILYNKEMHFVDMKKSKNGRDIIKKILSLDIINEEHVQYEYIDKQFCIYAQIVDMTIEPVFHSILRYNFYKNKYNIKIANLFYIFMLKHKNKNLVKEYLQSFEDMMRQQTDDYINKFYDKNEALIVSADTNDDLKIILQFIQMSKNIKDAVIPYGDKYCLDTTLTSFINLVNYWSTKHNSKLNIITDNSKQLKDKETIIKELTSIKHETIVGHGSRKHKYPLAIDSFTMVDSSNNFGVQLADIIASAVAFCINNKSKKYERFQKELCDSNILKIRCLNIMPSDYEYLNTIDDKPDDIDPIDFLEKELYPN